MAASPLNPAAMWTTVPPAKSMAPLAPRIPAAGKAASLGSALVQSNDQTQWGVQLRQSVFNWGQVVGLHQAGKIAAQADADYGTAHNATTPRFLSDPGSGAPNHAPGDRFTLKFDQPGVYELHCKLHAIVRGRVVVSDTPGTGAPSTDPDPKPAKTTRWIAPMRAQASMAMIASAQVGM